MSVEKYDVIVIGSGPSGQKAAVHAAKAGHRTAIIERDPVIGGSCVHRGTIPSKTLRENALRVKEMRRNATFANFQLAEETELAVLLKRLKKVLMAHDEYMQRQIKRENVEFIHGRAKFMDPHTLEVVRIRREPLTIQAKKIVIATGSFPRNPPSMPVDHEHVLDSDSILSLLYLPQSLTVLGGGVIASEYASIFQALGVKVTMIDKYPLPLGFLDDDLTKSFVDAFENMGGTWIGNASVEEVYWDGVDQVVSVLKSGEEFRSNKLLSAAGRVANVDDLQIQNAGLSLNDQQLISVNDRLQTDVEHIYAAGDVIGPPSLASSSMEQGRRAISNAIGSPVEDMSELIPSGIYSIPELSCVGLSERDAKEKFGEVMIGCASFDEIARGQISGALDGMLKLVADVDGKKLLGVMIVGEGATELVHIGQMALIHGAEIDVFVENVFNFPTFAEAFREAALDIIWQRSSKMDDQASGSKYSSDCAGKLVTSE